VIALSIRQPWAAAILHLGKRIENRTWNTSRRGEFLLHASKGMTRAEYDDALDWCEDVLGIARCYEIDDAFAREHLAFGAIVGRARLADVVPPRPDYMAEGVETHYPEIVRNAPAILGAAPWRWHMREQFGLVLADVVAFPRPIPCSGRLGFFDVRFDREGRPT